MKVLSGLFPILVEITQDSELYIYVIIAAVFGLIAGFSFKKKAGQIALLVAVILYFISEISMHLPLGIKIQLVTEFLGTFALGCALGMMAPVLIRGFSKNSR